MPAHTTTTLAAEGTLLKISIASTMTLVGQRVSLDGPDPELKMRDVSDLDSTSVKKRPGIPDLGKMSGKLWYDPNDAVHIAMRAKVIAPPATPDLFEMVYPDGMVTQAKDDFSGFITKFKPTGMEVNGTLEAEFEIDITDSFTSTPGAAT